jgi:ribosomal protein L11 methyltransferase
MPWLSLTLEVEAAAADALSDALLEAGTLAVSIDDPLAPRCRVSALLDASADPSRLMTDVFATLGGKPARYEVETVGDQDWVRRSQSQFPPAMIGERLWIGPSWCVPPVSDRACVTLDPGLAFGTGTHPSTRLVLRFLERTLRGGESVLDYGCGSGILAIAAAKLGASRVDAVDVDPQSVETATENASRNGSKVRVAAPEALAPALYDTVVSNILAQPLILLAPLLAGRVRPGGRIALSGILDSQAAEVGAAYAPYFEASVAQSEEGWALVEGRRQ